MKMLIDGKDEKDKRRTKSIGTLLAAFSLTIYFGINWGVYLQIILYFLLLQLTG